MAGDQLLFRGLGKICLPRWVQSAPGQSNRGQVWRILLSAKGGWKNPCPHIQSPQQTSESPPTTSRGDPTRQQGSRQ